MKVIHGLDSPELPLPVSSLTIGNFDGVHRGHQQIIAQTGLSAENTGAPTVVLTFEPHPLAIVSPHGAPPRLTPLAEKLDRLGEAGADLVVVARADRSLLSLTPEQFAELIVERLGPKQIVEGTSFGFGRGRSGTTETLRELGIVLGFEVLVVDPVRLQVDGETAVDISSSLIRRLLEEGSVHRAALCLGRPYALFGRVVSGTHRGVTLGFPTANLEIDDQLIPGDGVYAGIARADAEVWPAAISIGAAPTFQQAGDRIERRVEAHLLDAEVDLYGRQMRVEFGVRLRAQQKFDSADALRIQIAKDVQAVRRYAAGEQPSPGPQVTRDS